MVALGIGGRLVDGMVGNGVIRADSMATVEGILVTDRDACFALGKALAEEIVRA